MNDVNIFNILNIVDMYNKIKKTWLPMLITSLNFGQE